MIILVLSIGIFFLQFQYKKTYQPHTYYQVYLDEKVIGIIESKTQLEEYISAQGTLIKDQVIKYREQLEIIEAVDDIITDELSNYSDTKVYLSLARLYDTLYELVDEDGNFLSENKDQVEQILSQIPIEEPVVLDSRIRNYSAYQEQLGDYFISLKKVIVSYLLENEDSLSLSETETYYLETYQSQNLQDVSYVKQVYMEEYISVNEVYVYAEDVYSPIGLSVEKINTYYANLSTVEEVYQTIVKEKPCTIEGYQFRIKKADDTEVLTYASVGGLLLEDYQNLVKEESSDVIIYVTEEEVFRNAIEQLEMVFVGTEEYEKYINGTQDSIVDTGTRIDDIYVAEDITIKKTNISVGEKIYNDADELSSFLLYGENKSEKIVYASATDTIFSLTYEYGISIEEFFLSNSSFTSVNNIFYENQPVVIAQIDPQISVIVEQYTVEDLEVVYDTVEKYDSTLNQGIKIISQEGENGLERVSQNIQITNGSITYVDPVSNVTLQQAKNEIVLIGTKVVPSVGSTSSWYWPTASGYRISSYFGYRTSPITGKRELHSGIDIAGTGMGSPVYAANNGTIYAMIESKINYGIHMIINHNNGYYTLYGHMSGFVEGLTVGTVVSRGQQIGYVGSTGYSTGPHLHFEIRTCPSYSCVIDPWPYLQK